MNNSTNGKRTDSEVDTDRMTGFLQKNVKYISAGILVAALAAVIAVTATGNSKNSDDKDKTEPDVKTEQSAGDGADADAEENKAEKEHEYEVDLPEVKELVSTYYNSYAAGDVDKLDTIAQSLSDMEKSYIKMMNEYVESYNNIKCYTKAGLEEGSYMASVAYDMKFHNVEKELPGMDFFYIRTDGEGKLYIDNLYSYFNRETKEQGLNENIEASIKEFENGEDVKQLIQEYNDKYGKAVEEDADLQKMVDTVKNAVEEWVNSYTPQEETPEGEGEASETPEGNGEDADTNEDNNGDAANEDNNDAANEDADNEQPADTDNDDNTENTDNTNNGTSGLNYVPEGTVMTASARYNVRASMDESAELLGTVIEGDSIKVILSYAEGWTKVEWNNKTGYIRTDLLLNN